ncbi:MAG: tyrosine-type recombinase/integrase [Chloroflexota bacterium]
MGLISRPPGPPGTHAEEERGLGTLATVTTLPPCRAGGGGGLDWKVYLADPAVDLPVGVPAPPVPARMPFLIADDGAYAADVNHWLRQLPSGGARSPNTWLAYARDASVWLRFLAKRDVDLWSATDDDVAAFHATRRLSGPHARVSASSWNRAVSSLDGLYAWGVEHGRIVVSPFKHRIVRSATGAPLRVNQAKEKGARTGDLRFLALDQYLRFRDVGLLGHLPDGSEDPSGRVVTGFRNALFADLLVTTGMRMQECGSLLVAEIPAIETLPPGQKSVAFALAPAICKRRKGRTIRLPVRLVRELHRYVDLDRSLALANWRPSSEPDYLIVTDADSLGARIVGRKRRIRWADVDPATRRRVLIDKGDGPQPLSLWISDRGGKPINPAHWTGVFDLATQRCRRAGVEVRATPHMLRHTFAVHTLGHLVREVIALGRPSPGGQAAYQRVIADPLRTLQRLLGHSDLATTHQYLQYTDDAQHLVDDAVSAWADDIAAVAEAAGGDGEPR